MLLYVILCDPLQPVTGSVPVLEMLLFYLEPFLQVPGHNVVTCGQNNFRVAAAATD